MYEELDMKKKLRCVVYRHSVNPTHVPHNANRHLSISNWTNDDQK